MKQMTKYIFSEGIKVVAVYCLVLFVVFTALAIIDQLVYAGIISSSFLRMNVQLTSVVVMFILGIISFWMFVNAGLANSVSRRVIFRSLLVAGLTLAAIAATVEVLLNIAMSLITTGALDFNTGFAWFSFSVSMPIAVTAMLCFYVVMSCAGLLFGYLVAGLYYRMNTRQAVLVSVVVPVVLMGIIMPLFMNMRLLLDDTTYTSLMRLWEPVVTFANSPFHAALLVVVLIMLLAILMWRLIRRASARPVER